MQFFQVSEGARQKYIKNLSEQMKLLKKAAEESDFKTIQDLSHKIKGSAALYGYPELGIICGNLEEMGKSQNRRSVDDCLFALKKSFQKI